MELSHMESYRLTSHRQDLTPCKRTPVLGVSKLLGQGFAGLSYDKSQDH